MTKPHRSFPQRVPFLSKPLLITYILWLWTCGCKTSQPKTARTSSRTKPPMTATVRKTRYRLPRLNGRFRLRRGPHSAPIHVIELLNPTHPQSQRIHQLRKRLFRTFPGGVRWDVLLTPHLLKDRGYLYARAMLAAKRFERFWEYLDLFFQTPKSLSLKALYQLAKPLRISPSHFEIYLHFAPLNMWIDRDMRQGLRFTSLGEPMLFFNGAHLPPPYTHARLCQAAQESIREIQSLLQQGRTLQQAHIELQQNGRTPPTKPRHHPAIAPRKYIHIPFALKEQTPFLGPGDALIHLVEFSDFTCK
ncbi:MAG: hypothetical protein AAGJ35_05260, partial [Myxococcota bacterium]